MGVGSFQQRGAQACAELGSLVGLAHHTSRWTTGPERWVTPQTVDSSLSCQFLQEGISPDPTCGTLSQGEGRDTRRPPTPGSGPPFPSGARCPGAGVALVQLSREALPSCARAAGAEVSPLLNVCRPRSPWRPARRLVPSRRRDARGADSPGARLSSPGRRCRPPGLAQRRFHRLSYFAPSEQV